MHWVMWGSFHDIKLARWKMWQCHGTSANSNFAKMPNVNQDWRKHLINIDIIYCIDSFEIAVNEIIWTIDITQSEMEKQESECQHLKLYLVWIENSFLMNKLVARFYRNAISCGSLFPILGWVFLFNFMLRCHFLVGIFFQWELKQTYEWRLIQT